MKASLTILFGIFGLLSFGIFTGFVGIRYPRVIENEPLVDPVAISRVEGSLITLADGRILEFEDDAPKGSWEDFFASGRKIDLEEHGPDELIVWAIKPGWVCGTPWARPIRIPLIADDVYRNKREIVSFATCRNPDKQAGQKDATSSDR